MEEYRDLSIHEWNFREVLIAKLTSLLKQQQIYWKQRGTVKWVRFGDAGTKFFHGHATIRHRKNLITVLEDTYGQLQTRHPVKVQILWEAYKERLGLRGYQHMLYDLNALFGDQIDLAMLEEPFQHEEIDQVVAALPSDKSPGPDGFNTGFVKKC